MGSEMCIRDSCSPGARGHEDERTRRDKKIAPTNHGLPQRLSPPASGLPPDFPFGPPQARTRSTRLASSRPNSGIPYVCRAPFTARAEHALMLFLAKRRSVVTRASDRIARARRHTQRDTALHDREPMAEAAVRDQVVEFRAPRRARASSRTSGRVPARVTGVVMHRDALRGLHEHQRRGCVTSRVA